jgi:uncharacterized protein (DUF697 family)
MRALRTLWATVREFDVAQIRDEIEQPIRIGISGPPTAARDAVAAILADGSAVSVVEAIEPTGDDGALRRLSAADLLLFVVPADAPPTLADLEAVYRAAGAGAPFALVVASHGRLPIVSPPTNSYSLVEVREDAPIAIDLDRPDEVESILGAAILERLGARRLSVARHVPRLRDQVARQLIGETAGANAKFALLSTIPGWIPVLGGLAGNIADLAVLTKNQVLLVLKLAGIYGRDLSHWRPLLLEVAPVVGGAFFWRSVARSLVALLPNPLAPVPKTAIAYVGTATVGEIARRYYRDGIRLSPQAVRSVQERAVERFRSLALRRPSAPVLTT